MPDSVWTDEFELPFAYHPRRENLVRWIDGERSTEEMLAYFQSALLRQDGSFPTLG